MEYGAIRGLCGRRYNHPLTMFPSVQKSKTIVSSSRMLLKSLAILERYLSSSLLLMAVMSLCLRTDYKTTFMKIFK
jgi:hypothetical protein